MAIDIDLQVCAIYRRKYINGSKTSAKSLCFNWFSPQLNYVQTSFKYSVSNVQGENQEVKMMLEDESEPEFNFSSTSTISSENDTTAHARPFARRHSVSLQNISSTPYTRQTSNAVKNRYSSQQTVDSSKKPKRRKYDHIESKIKRNLIESKRQQEAVKERKRRDEQLRKTEQRKMADEKAKDEEITKETVDMQLLSNQFVHLEEKYSQTLQRIDTLQSDLDKIRADSFKTPRMVNRRNNLQTSLIKTLLFNSSTSGNYMTANTPRLSIFDDDSSCMTLDVADTLPTDEITQFNNQAVSFHEPDARQNPFLINSLTASPARSYDSESPLLFEYHERTEPRSRFRTFLYKLVRCPKVRDMRRTKVFNCYARFRNRVTPGTIPTIAVHSPSGNESDSGHQSDERFNRIRMNIFRKPRRNNWNDFNCCANQDLLLEQLTQCADELTCKLNTFKTLASEYLNKKSD